MACPRGPRVSLKALRDVEPAFRKMIYQFSTLSYDVVLRDRLDDAADAFTVLACKGDVFIVYLQTARPSAVLYNLLREFDVRPTSMRAMLEFMLLPFGPLETVIATSGAFRTAYGRPRRLFPSAVDLTRSDSASVVDMPTVRERVYEARPVIDLTCDETPVAL